MDVAALARADQGGSGGVYRVDVWFNVKLQAVTKLWQGIGGTSCYFFGEEDAREARGAYVGTDPYVYAESLWRGLQIRGHAAHGHRGGMAEFVVDIDTPAALGVCDSNTAYGRGGLLQYFIPNWASVLHATGREYTFSKKGY